VLVVLAGLCGRSLSQLRSVNLGFHDQNVIAFSLEYPRAWKPAQRKAARDQFLDAVAAMPGVSRVSYGVPGPFLSGTSTATVRVPGSEAATDQRWVSVHWVAPGYFETIGAAPVAGREFVRSDTPSGRQVALVNQAFVRELLDGTASPLGRTIERSETA